MGACGSNSAAALEAQRIAEELDKKNREDYERQQQKIKLLLLGEAAFESFISYMACMLADIHRTTVCYLSRPCQCHTRYGIED